MVGSRDAVDAAWLRAQAQECLRLARLAVVPEAINGLAALALEFERKAQQLEDAQRERS